MIYLETKEVEEAKTKPKLLAPDRITSAVSKKSVKPLDENYLQNTELFLCKWEENENNDQVRIELLDEFLNRPELRLSLFKRKQEFLICLNQCIESENPALYEKGVIIASDLIDINVITEPELLSLNPVYQAIR